MIDENGVYDSNTVLCVERIHLPVEVSNWMFKEAGYVFECSPALSVVSWLLGALNELIEVAISLLS